MRPYLAVLKDSFREAFASRVLWITLGLIAVFLLVIAPIGLNPGLMTRLQREEISDGFGLLTKISQDAKKSEPSPGKHLWTSMPEDLRSDAEEMIESKKTGRPRSQLLGRVRRELNNLLAKPEFYDKESWAEIPMDDELRDKLNAENRKGVEEVNVANRNAFEAAFDDYVTLGQGSAVYFSYAGFRLFDSPLPFSSKEREFVVESTINGVLSLLMGILGIFVSILVTASFIPRTFEPGEITLLLSKPVSRPFLFLTKFLGGCAFTLLNATFFLIGIWLIAGLRFDIWNHNLLWCIPVYVFVFAIYYAVSAGAGAIWQNAIISVVATIIFWAFISGVGIIKGLTDQFAIEPERITEIVPAGDKIMSATSSKELRVWNEKTKEWDSVFRNTSTGGPPAFVRRIAFANSRFRPVYDAKRDRLVAMNSSGRGGATQVVTGSEDEEWIRKNAGNAPASVDMVVLDSKDRVLLIGPTAIFHFVRKNEEAAKVQDYITKMTGFTFKGSETDFPNLRPKKLETWRFPASYAFDRSTDRLAVFSKGKVQVLKPGQAPSKDETDKDEEKPKTKRRQLGKPNVIPYEVAVERDFESEDDAIIGMCGNRIVLVYEDGRATILNADTLEDVTEVQAFDDAPRVIEGSPDGKRIAVVSHSRDLWLYDTESDKPVSGSIGGQGDISAIAFDSDSSLLVADNLSRVRKYKAESSEASAAYSPAPTTMQQVHRYVVTPIYTVLPKPGELSNLITWLTTDQKTVAINNENPSLQTERVKLDLWTPIWSSAAFLVFTLLITCLYISRRDF